MFVSPFFFPMVLELSNTSVGKRGGESSVLAPRLAACAALARRSLARRTDERRAMPHVARWAGPDWSSAWCPDTWRAAPRAAPAGRARPKLGLEHHAEVGAAPAGRGQSDLIPAYLRAEGGGSRGADD